MNSKTLSAKGQEFGDREMGVNIHIKIINKFIVDTAWGLHTIHCWHKTCMRSSVVQ